MYEQAIDFLNNFGFPVAMVMYFAWHEQTILKPLETALNKNTLVLNRLFTKLDMEEVLDIEEDSKK